MGTHISEIISTDLVRQSPIIKCAAEPKTQNSQFRHTSLHTTVIYILQTTCSKDKSGTVGGKIVLTVLSRHQSQPSFGNLLWGLQY
jgi:hypothetical protein